MGPNWRDCEGYSGPGKTRLKTKRLLEPSIPIRMVLFYVLSSYKKT
ncbi:hypothetical protein PMIT1327_00015 [Prochlorococcus marinus str. MIT 1327]|nr:hypothetical protein PMIT1312_00161 [Prochlorococcus marinus str. MIT 1312]KZR85084.1 hypothetical protein PMIT1327_00015 [Prochlorococcus marinus str. MIT 1327]